MGTRKIVRNFSSKAFQPNAATVVGCRTKEKRDRKKIEPLSNFEFRNFYSRTSEPTVFESNNNLSVT